MPRARPRPLDRWMNRVQAIALIGPAAQASTSGMVPSALPQDEQRRVTNSKDGIGTVFRYRVAALLRGNEPGLRSSSDTRRVVRLARHLQAGSGIRVVLYSAASSRQVEAWLDVFGPDASSVTHGDLATACRLSLSLAEGGPANEPQCVGVTHAHELTRIRTAPIFGASAEERAFAPEWMAMAKNADRCASAQPKPSMDHGEELVRALSRADQDTWVVATLTAPSTLDQDLLLDELDVAHGRPFRAERAGAIVCARTIVASTGPVSPAVLAGLVSRSPDLEASLLSPREAVSMLTEPSVALRGYAVTEDHAAALIRVPTASDGGGLGIASRLPDPKPRPLDPPLPEATTPVRLGTAVDYADDPLDVVLDSQDLRRHMFVEGKTGTGKSAVLKSIAISWLETGLPLVVLDPHGDVASAVAARAADRRGRVTHYIRHGDVEHPIGLNLLAEPDEELWEQNVDSLLTSMARILDPTMQGMFGDRAKRTFWLVARAARHVYGARLTIHVIQTLLLSQSHLRSLAEAIDRVAADLARRIRAELVDLPDKEWSELVSWYQSRFQMWQRTRALRETTGTGLDAIDMTAVLDGNANLVVDLASMQLGDSVAGIIGGLYLTKIRAAMGRRADRDVPVLVAFDEAHLFADEAPDRLLAEGRKYGLALVIASQSADNLTPRLARAVEANVGSFVSLRTGINLAGSASNRLGGWPTNELTRLPDLTAAASLCSQGVPTDPFTLTVDYYARAEASDWTPRRTADAADRLAHETVKALWQPHAKAAVPTDTEVLAALRKPIRAMARRGSPESPVLDLQERPPADDGHEQWLVQETTARLELYHESPDRRVLDELYVLIGALKLAGFDDSYKEMRRRLAVAVRRKDADSAR